MKQLGKKALRIFVRLERLGIIWNGCFTVHDMCAETLYILCAFGDSTLNPLSGMQSLGGDTRQEFWIDSVCAVFRSVVVLKSCLVMSCWNLHVFLRLTVILLLLFLQVSPFFLCALAHIIMQLIFRPSAKKTPAATQRYLGSGDHSAELWYQRYQRCCLAAISSLEILCDLGNSSNHRVSYVWD